MISPYNTILPAMSDILPHSLITPRTAHYYTLGAISPAVTDLWIVCHGYGQSARGFLKSFRPLQQADRLIVAPEGLSRFYWGGFDGPVVASWMTRGDRLDEIADFSLYLSGLYQQLLPRLAPGVRITLLGFSQGVATVVRWAMQAFPRFDRLILCSGQLPEDLNYRPLQDYWSDKELYFCYGTEDPFLQDERLVFVQQVLNDSGLDFSTLTFTGEHEINAAVLREITAMSAG